MVNIETSKLNILYQQLLKEQTAEYAYYQIKEFIMNTSSDEIARYGMEYLAQNNFYKELVLLIEKNKQSTNALNKQWGIIYELLMRRKAGNISSDQLEEIVYEMEVEDPSLTALLTFMKIYICYDRYNYRELGNFLDPLTEQISQIRHPFISELINVRKKEVLFHYHWKRNEVVIARKYGFAILKESKNFFQKSHIHLSVGQTYLFESYEKSMVHFFQAKRIAEKYNYHHLIKIIDEQTIPFTAAFFHRTDGVETTDLMEKAHLLIANGKYANAKEILLKMESTSPFYKLYLGVIDRDEALLKESFRQFFYEESDHFYARLPIYYLNKFGFLS